MNHESDNLGTSNGFWLTVILTWAAVAFLCFVLSREWPDSQPIPSTLEVLVMPCEPSTPEGPRITTPR